MEILILLILGLILAAIYMFFIKKDGPIVVTELVVYPIKGAGFVRLTEANVFEQGIAEDRRWFLTNDNKEVITQRENTKILKIQPKFVYSKEGKLTHMTLSYENMPDFNLEIKGITTNVIPITWRTAVFNGQEETQGVAE